LDAEPGLPGTHWPVERFGRFAEQLGRGQGRYLAGEPVPTLPWLSRGFLRQYALESKPVDGSAYTDDALWACPAVEPLRPLRDRLHALWEERELYTTVVESLPATVCHLDVWPPNLVADGGDSVLLDWSFAGIGAIGEDVGNLVPDCVFDGWLAPADLPALDAAVTAGHLAGLRAAGWDGDPREVRLGVVAAGAAKYCWLAELVLRRAVDGSAAGYGGATDPDRLPRIAVVLDFLLGWADEARSLAAALPSRSG
ncbi:MAG: phosphotransferase, partial [Pseudonocardia sp.]|nr:phosphotransferase [Pseudonocardia sp.]